jgi:hypothetical protein
MSRCKRNALCKQLDASRNPLHGRRSGSRADPVEAEPSDDRLGAGRPVNVTERGALDRQVTREPGGSPRYATIPLTHVPRLLQ